MQHKDPSQSPHKKILIKPLLRHLLGLQSQVSDEAMKDAEGWSESIKNCVTQKDLAALLEGNGKKGELGSKDRQIATLLKMIAGDL